MRHCGFLLVLPLLCILLVLSCAWPDTTVPIAELLDAPTVLDRDGRTLLLYASLSRNFMPGEAPPDGSGLVVHVKVWSEDSLPTNVDLTTDRVWVIRRSARAVWEAEARLYTPAPHGFLCATAATEGPKWDIGLLCDVVMRLVDTDGRTWLFRAPDVEIEMIW